MSYEVINYVTTRDALRACESGPRIARFTGMDYEKLKALMEASREESAVPHAPEVKEFPKPDSRLVGNI
jgi:hypothetical protein